VADPKVIKFKKLYETDIDILKGCFSSFHNRHIFNPGDIVQWKPKLRNRTLAGPFVVMEVLDTPVFKFDQDHHNCYFNEPLDVIIGSIDLDGDLLCYHFDSRRLEPYKFPETQ